MTSPYRRPALRLVPPPDDDEVPDPVWEVLAAEAYLAVAVALGALALLYAFGR